MNLYINEINCSCAVAVFTHKERERCSVIVRDTESKGTLVFSFFLTSHLRSWMMVSASEWLLMIASSLAEQLTLFSMVNIPLMSLYAHSAMMRDCCRMGDKLLDFIKPLCRSTLAEDNRCWAIYKRFVWSLGISTASFLLQYIDFTLCWRSWKRSQSLVFAHSRDGGFLQG